MGWVIRIDFVGATVPSSLVHQIRNFGEDVWRFAKTEKGAAISLHDIDRATDRLELRINSSRRVRPVVREVERLLGEHFLDGCARVLVTNVGGGVGA